MNSALYVGKVAHQRARGIVHRLSYRVWMIYVDLDALDELQERLSLLRRRAYGLISFLPSDHGDRDGGDLKGQIQAKLMRAGLDLGGGPVRLLTMPRVLGYGFNPISVYFCHHADGRLGAVIYEVTNTFRERHSYVVAVPCESSSPVSQTSDKTLFVSPFMDMGMTYDFAVRPPEEQVSVAVTVRRDRDVVLTASFRGSRRPLTDCELLRAFATHPLLTWKVTWGIHWEAFKMMLKGARYRHRGPPPRHTITIGRSLHG